jgi:hypothetical protein
MERFNIANLQNGAVLEQADIVANKIYENIADPNTDIRKKRKMTITLTFVPVDRETAMVETEIKSTVCPYNPIKTQIYIGWDNDGNVQASEMVKGQMVNQTTFVDKSTGEIISEKKESGEPTGRKVLNINR